MEGLSGDLKDAVVRGDVDYLMDALTDASFDVRVAAIEGLARLGGERARMALMRIAHDRWGERPEIRIAAIRSLGRISEKPRYMSLLEDFIANDNRKVVAASRAILRDLDPEGFPARLASRGCLDHNAIRYYGDSREADAVPLLEGYIRELMTSGDLTAIRHWGKVFASVKSLGNIGGEESVQTLVPFLEWLEAEPQVEKEGFRGQRLEKIREATRKAIGSAGRG